MHERHCVTVSRKQPAAAADPAGLVLQIAYKIAAAARGQIPVHLASCSVASTLLVTVCRMKQVLSAPTPAARWRLNHVIMHSTQQFSTFNGTFLLHSTSFGGGSGPCDWWPAGVGIPDSDFPAIWPVWSLVQ